jgi:hypothetical protein
LDAENHREKRSLAELMSCILNAANTEKMSMTGLQPTKTSEKNLSRNQRKRGPPKEFALGKGHERDNRLRALTARLSRAAESGEIFSFGGGQPAPSLIQRRGN